MSFRSALYRGELVHARTRRHARRAFRYAVYMAAIDLDELPALDRELRLFSHDGANLFSSASATTRRRYRRARARSPASCRRELGALRAANGLPAPRSTRLVTNLRAFGYLFNPVSFFIDYDAAVRSRA